MGRFTSGGIGRDILAGAAAGAAAVWIIDRMQLHTTHAAVTPEAPTRVDPAHNIANRAAAKAGAQIGPEHDNEYGHAVHYAVGAGLGALYGLLRGMAPSVTSGRGTVYGFVTYLIGDEIGMPALGLAKGPLHYPMKDHARGALGHTLYGVFTDLGTRLMSPYRDEVIVLQGPSIHERLSSGRHYLADQGRWAAEQGRSYYRSGRDAIADAAEGVDVSGYAQRGRKHARRLVERVSEYLPDADDLADYVAQGRRYVGDVAEGVYSRMPDREDVRDNVEDVVERGRKRARRAAEDARSGAEDAYAEGRRRAERVGGRLRDRAPDRDDVDEAVDTGRRRVRDLAHQARDQAQETGGSPVKRLLGWLLG